MGMKANLSSKYEVFFLFQVPLLKNFLSGLNGDFFVSQPFHRGAVGSFIDNFGAKVNSIAACADISVFHVFQSDKVKACTIDYM